MEKYWLKIKTSMVHYCGKPGHVVLMPLELIYGRDVEKFVSFG